VQGNETAAIKIMPPGYLDVLSQKVGMSRDVFIQMLIKDSAHAAKKEKIEKFSYDLNRTNVYKSSRSRTYAFIPTVIRAKMDGKTAENIGYYLGIKERRYWYFIGWDKEMIPVLLEAYPDLSEQKLPK
jgi:hypothetical protein